MLLQEIISVGLLLTGQGVFCRPEYRDEHKQQNNDDHSINLEMTTMKSTTDFSRKERIICETRECVGRSESLFQYMDLTADPCQDFVQFSCGEFYANNQIPEDKSQISPFTYGIDNLKKRGRKLLEKPPLKKDKHLKAHEMARIHYKACSDEVRLEELGVNPLRRIIEEVNGGWPVLEEDKWGAAKENAFKWYELVYALAEAGQSSDFLLDISIDIDDKNNSWRALHLDQPSLGMPREYLIKGFDDKYVRHYYKYMVDTALLLRVDSPKEDCERVKAEMKDMLLFEIELANISKSKEERRDPNDLYNPYKASELESLPDLPPSWVDFLQTKVNMITKGSKLTLKITNQEKVIVRNPDFLPKLSQLLQRTDSRTVANYMMWRTSMRYMNAMNEAARNIRQTYVEAVYGIKKSLPTWERCVTVVGFDSYSHSTFGIAASNMYIHEYFKPEDKAAVQQMSHYIREGFRSMLADLTWMEEETKLEAERKLDKMKQFLGFPNELANDTLVEEIYQGIEVSELEYIGNLIELKKFWTRWSYSRLREEVDPDSWLNNQLTVIVNAYYNPTINLIYIPAGILQGIFFNSKIPNYMNFGAIGTIIGHEITHGFDDTGRKRNYKGEVKDWWGEETSKRFNKRAQCIVDQYSAFTSKQVDMNVNGISSQGESIADSGGVKEAYRGYNFWLKDRGGLETVEESLPGFNYTFQQMFWISWGQQWCFKYTNETLINLIKTGHHPPSNFRIIGVVSNSYDFARDFNCPVGSPMNPEKKCTVW